MKRSRIAVALLACAALAGCSADRSTAPEMEADGPRLNGGWMGSGSTADVPTDSVVVLTSDTTHIVTDEDGGWIGGGGR